jgi:ABC-type uncharacterized transport system ATPase subunit
MTTTTEGAGVPTGALAVPELEMRGITKRYPGVVANDGIDLAVARGEIHALMGENGAGKSTLMGILYGLVSPDEGEVLLAGTPVRFHSPIDAIAHGLGMVHQAFKLFPSLRVWENVVYRAEPRRGVRVDRAESRRRVAELAAAHGLPVDPDARVGALSVGERQRVEILKALYRDARILILDEPTAVLTPLERDGLFAVMRSLAAEGRTIVFVTHKIHEVLAVTDAVTVLRDGRVVARMRTADATAASITQAMTGRNVALVVDKTPAEPGAPVLTVEGLRVAGEGRPAVDDVSFTVRAGEIVGIAGVAGNGQTELVESLVGLRRPEAGRVLVQDRDVTTATVLAHRDAGLAHIPEDRAAVGTAPAASASANLGMGVHRHPPLSERGVLRPRAWRARAAELIERFAIRIPGPDTPVGSLSGGNLQKVVVARELSHGAAVLVAEQPTRGVDVGAIEFIHARLVAERDAGCGVLLVSAELSEVLSLADRILVMYEGRLVAEVPGGEATEARLGLLMAGGS